MVAAAKDKNEKLRFAVQFAGVKLQDSNRKGTPRINFSYMATATGPIALLLVLLLLRLVSTVRSVCRFSTQEKGAQRAQVTYKRGATRWLCARCYRSCHFTSSFVSRWAEAVVVGSWLLVSQHNKCTATYFCDKEEAKMGLDGKVARDRASNYGASA
jgi:hypothetical protein